MKNILRRSLTLIILLLLSLCAKARLEVQQGSFKESEGFVIIDHDKTDVNNVPFAVIKVRTQNIDDKQRRELIFQGNAAIDVDLAYKTGEVWVYLTYEADYVKISHPDFSSTEFWLPFDMKPGHGYEMTLVNKSNIGVVAVAPVKMSYNYLIVKADQTDAMIYIDDVFVGTGSVSKSFKVGEKHRWRIECALYHSESGEAMIMEGEKVKVEKTLRPAFGYVNMTSTPESGASVLVDGNLVGVTPFKTDRLSSGEHKIKVMKEMFSPTEKTVTVTDGNTTQAAITLSANFVNVTVTTDSNSDIYIDNEKVGKGRWTGRLSDGDHTFEARKASHRSSFKNVNLTLGKDETVNISNPEPIYGTIDVNSDPMEAVIFIDGVRRGETPAIISDVLVGTHELKLEKTGCASVTKTFTIDEGSTITISEKLEAGIEISISTDQSGDKLYIDGNYLGISPLTATLTFGTHNIKAIRESDNSRFVEKIINVSHTSDETLVRMAFRPEINGHEYVDLGLPSGTLWATCNVGANSPEDYGNYYAWGETTTKSTYNWSTYKYCRGSYDTQTKYNIQSNHGSADNGDILEMPDDSAHANWGGSWRMPTYDELNELKTKCTWTWISQSGKDGYRVTGPNGKSIFLPAAGYRNNGKLDDARLIGYYWSSSFSAYFPHEAYGLSLIARGINSGSVYVLSESRDDGRSVRPVSAPQN